MTDQGGYLPPYAPPYTPPYEQTYGQPSPWVTPAHGPVPAPVPATVRAAAIVTYVCSAITVAMTLLMTLFLAFLGSIAFSFFDKSDRGELVAFVLAGVLFSLLCSAIACWFAWQTSRRKGWARYGLAVCSGLTVALSLAAFSPPTLVGILGGAAVLVLLFVPESNAWFRNAD
ncbi:MAG: hypothetical protein ACJ72D_00370 [Marmoricola sp.]